jgi:hypothetical protein
MLFYIQGHDVPSDSYRHLLLGWISNFDGFFVLE